MKAVTRKVLHLLADLRMMWHLAEPDLANRRQEFIRRIMEMKGRKA